MRVRTAMLLLATGFLAAPPGVEACSLAAPIDFQHLQWLDEDTLITNDGNRVGRYDLTARTFEPWLDTLAATVSPDGRRIAFWHGDPRPPRLGVVDTCASGRLGGLEAIEVATGERTHLADGAPLLINSGEAHLLWRTALKEHVQLARWDDLGSPRDLPLPVPLDGVAGLTFAAGDRILLATVRDEDAPVRLYAFDVATGRPLEGGAPVETDDSGRFRHGSVASAPTQAAAAFVRGGDIRFGEVHLVRLDRGRAEAFAYAASAETPGRAAWGPRGLAVAYQERTSWYEAGEPSTVLRVFDGPGDLSDLRQLDLGNRSWVVALAWSPSGARLAMVTPEGLNLLDPELREVATHALDTGPTPARFRPLQDAASADVRGAHSVPMPAWVVLSALAFGAWRTRRR